MQYTQENRLIKLETPLGGDVLLLRGFTGSEGISRLFNFHLDLLSEDDKIDFKKIIGQDVTIRVLLTDGSNERYFSGVVSRFAQAGSATKLTNYQMEVVPWPWFLTRNADCRIFQKMSVPDIIKKVFDNHGFSQEQYKFSLTGSYDKVEYCVQYRETDFNFISRLMEHNGIFYYFTHEKGKHTMVLGDSDAEHQPCPNQASVNYQQTGGALDSDDVITSWSKEQELRTGKYSLTDYNFEKPSLSLMSNETTLINVGNNSRFEIYDYPGDHMEKARGASLAKLRMQEEEASHTVISGSSTCRAFTSGYKFDLKEHYRDDANESYLLTEVQHVATMGSYAQEDTPAHYSNHFTCIPASVPFRPPRVTPKPFVQGPQTAMVVGVSGEEITVDQHGRVKVQFYWDRLGQKNENSSCWIRVSQPWGGAGWGAMWIPRIGQEVVVSFLEGDPDRPLITGRVYNGNQLPPYKLPDHQTVSTFMSHSSKGGSGYNEIRFDDKKDSEQIFIKAQKDMDQRVAVDSREFVGANRFLNVGTNQVDNIGADKHITVGANHLESIATNMSLTVGKDLMESVGNDQHLTIAKNFQEDIGKDVHTNIGENQVENVGKNVDTNIGESHIKSVGKDVQLNIGAKRIENIGSDLHLTIGSNRVESVGSNLDLSVGSNRSEQIGGNQSLDVSSNCDEKIGSNYALTAGQNVSVEGSMNITLQAGMQLSLVGPGGFITIGPAGVAIQGTMVMINSGGAAGSATSASPKSPKSPESPQSPKSPEEPKDPDTPKSPQIADAGGSYSDGSFKQNSDPSGFEK